MKQKTLKSTKYDAVENTFSAENEISICLEIIWKFRKNVFEFRNHFYIRKCEY